jgi:hypothetical protein
VNADGRFDAETFEEGRRIVGRLFILRMAAYHLRDKPWLVIESARYSPFPRYASTGHRGSIVIPKPAFTSSRMASVSGTALASLGRTPAGRKILRYKQVLESSPPCLRARTLPKRSG